MRKVMLEEDELARKYMMVVTPEGYQLHCYHDHSSLCRTSCVAAIVEDATFTCAAINLTLQIVKPKKHKR